MLFIVEQARPVIQAIHDPGMSVRGMDVITAGKYLKIRLHLFVTVGYTYL